MVENGVFPSKKPKNAQKSKNRPQIAKTHPKSFEKLEKKIDFFYFFLPKIQKTSALPP